MDLLGGRAQFQNETCDVHPTTDDTFTGSYTLLLMGEPLDPSRVLKQSHGYEFEQDTLLIGEALGSQDVPEEGFKEQSEVDPTKGSTLNSKPSGLIHTWTPSASIFTTETYQSMRICSLEIPAGKYVVDFLTRFARTNSRPGVALTVTGGNGTVCNLKLQSPWRNDLHVGGNAEIVTISKTFQADWWGSMKDTSVAIMVVNSSRELCGGTVKGDMQVVDQVILNVCIFS